MKYSILPLTLSLALAHASPLSLNGTTPESTAQFIPAKRILEPPATVTFYPSYRNVNDGVYAYFKIGESPNSLTFRTTSKQGVNCAAALQTYQQENKVLCDGRDCVRFGTGDDGQPRIWVSRDHIEYRFGGCSSYIWENGSLNTFKCPAVVCPRREEP